VFEDPTLEGAQCRARFEAELIGEHGSRALEGAQRVRLTPGTVVDRDTSTTGPQ